jgi:hypothetical protein
MSPHVQLSLKIWILHLGAFRWTNPNGGQNGGQTHSQAKRAGLIRSNVHRHGRINAAAGRPDHCGQRYVTGSRVEGRRTARDCAGFPRPGRELTDHIVSTSSPGFRPGSVKRRPVSLACVRLTDRVWDLPHPGVRFKSCRPDHSQFQRAKWLMFNGPNGSCLNPQNPCSQIPSASPKAHLGNVTSGP